MAKYFDYVYQIIGESLANSPKKLFDEDGVYLIADMKLKVIWIWAGVNSRLFHRYIAASWAGKLKSKKEYYNFKYEVIKQDKEPEVFKTILQEIKEKRDDLKFPGESRKNIQKDIFKNSEKGIPSHQISNLSSQIDLKLTHSQKSQMKKIISEIREIQMHIKYSFEHIERRIVNLEKILES